MRPCVSGNGHARRRTAADAYGRSTVGLVPIGYLMTAGAIALCALSAVARHRPRTSRPFRLSYVFGLWLNWPSVAFALLLASSALALAEKAAPRASGSGSASPRWRRGDSRFSPPAGEGNRPGRRARAGRGARVRLARPRGRRAHRAATPSTLAAPRPARRRSPSVAQASSGSRTSATARRGRGTCSTSTAIARRSGGPTLVYLHAGASAAAASTREARPLLYRLASHGWVCVSANYRLQPDREFPDPADRREAGDRLGARARPRVRRRPGRRCSSRAAPRAAISRRWRRSLRTIPPSSPASSTRTPSVAGAISLYGYYGPVGSDEPPSSPLAYVTTGRATVLHRARRPGHARAGRRRTHASRTLRATRRTRSSTRSSRARSTRSTCSARFASRRSSTRSRPSPPGWDPRRRAARARRGLSIAARFSADSRSAGEPRRAAL